MALFLITRSFSGPGINGVAGRPMEMSDAMGAAMQAANYCVPYVVGSGGGGADPVKVANLESSQSTQDSTIATNAAKIAVLEAAPPGTTDLTPLETEQTAQNARLDAIEAAPPVDLAPINAEIAANDVDIAANAADIVALQATDATQTTDIAALQAEQGTQDTAIATKAEAADLVTETTRATAAEAALQTELDAQEAKQDTHEQSWGQPHLPDPAALADDIIAIVQGGAWTTGTATPVAPENLSIVAAAPTAGDGADGDYWIDASQPLWPWYGPKAAGAWPATGGNVFSAATTAGTLPTFTDTDANERTLDRVWSSEVLQHWRFSNENFTPLADGGTAEVGTGRSVSPGSTIEAPATRPDGSPLQPGDYFSLVLDADGSITVNNVVESGTFAGVAWSSHAWITPTGTGTDWQDLDPALTALLTEAEATDPTSTVEGTVTGELLDAVLNARPLKVEDQYPAAAEVTVINSSYWANIPVGTEALFAASPVVDGEDWVFVAKGAVALDVSTAALMHAAIDTNALVPLASRAEIDAGGPISRAITPTDYDPNNYPKGHRQLYKFNVDGDLNIINAYANVQKWGAFPAENYPNPVPVKAGELYDIWWNVELGGLKAVSVRRHPVIVNTATATADVIFSKDGFPDGVARTLLVDGDGLNFRVSNNSPLTLLRSITADGTTADVVQPELTAFQVIPLNNGGIYDVYCVGTELTIAEQSFGGAAVSDFVPHIFEVSGTGAGASGGSPYMFQSFIAEQDGFYLPEPTEYDIYRNQSGTNRVSAHLQLNSSLTGGGTTNNPNELWRQYLQKANQPAGSTTDIAVTNDNGGPYIASVPVQLVAGATYYLYHISNTGYFRNSDTARVKFTKINTDPQLELPTSFVDLGVWTGVNLQTLVTNGMLLGNGTGSAGTGAPSTAWTGSCKVTAIGDWIQQDFLTANASGTVVGERFSRQSFDGGTTWSAWFGQ